MDPSLTSRSRTTDLVIRGLHGVLFAAAGALSFAGWGVSGTRTRSSYGLVRSVRSLELLDGVWATLAPVWFALPLLVAVGLVAVGYHRKWLMAAIAITVGGLLILGWWQVKVSPLGVDTGAAASAVLGACLIGVSLVSTTLFRGASSR